MDDDEEGGDALYTTQVLPLPEQDQQRLAQEPPVRDYLVGKYQRVRLELDGVQKISHAKLHMPQETKRNWDVFYRRNADNFFKDRHWLVREFPLLLRQTIDEAQEEEDGRQRSDGEAMDARAVTLPTAQPHHRPVLLELGCGVGNTVFPLRRANPALFVYACDVSARAVELVQANAEYDVAHVKAFQCDLTAADSLAQQVPPEACDMVTCFFVLSALGPSEWDAVLANVEKVGGGGGWTLRIKLDLSSSQVTRRGAHIFFRDYGMNDHAMVRFKVRGGAVEPPSTRHRVPTH
jgi:methyltransferase-like protein 6